jgi:hypothetical protein
MRRKAGKVAPQPADAGRLPIDYSSLYGVVVSDNSMFPEYRENDIAHIDPTTLNPKKDDACLFRSERPDGTESYLMAYLDRSPDASDTLYYLRTGRGGGFKKSTIKKADWQKCHRMVGWQSGR